MSASRRALRGSVTVLFAILSEIALGHPKLVSSRPANNSEVAAPKRIELRFSEELVFPPAGGNLVMAWLPGRALHGPMKIPAEVSRGGDAKTVVIQPTQPLMAGSYRVDWQAVSSDGHPVNGRIVFRVR